MIAILIIIIALQIYIFATVIKKIGVFKNVFNTFYELNSVKEISYNTKKSNTIFRTIVECINSYLRNNGSRANDYHLMQDIAERNCDSAEEEIQSQVPTTLYLGLMGTMFGIIFGLHGLDLSKMFSGKLETQTVTDLLNDVSTAMIASVCGIVFTTVLTLLFKNAKAQNASGKNLFLSWIQANLLPNMSSDVFSALDKMSNALSSFNSQFAENTQKLNATLSLVADTSKSQAELFEVINNLNVAEMAKANVKVYKSLKDSAEQIEHLGKTLEASKDYVDSVRQLNEHLDKNEDRTRMFEEMGNFFKQELAAVEERKKMFLATIDEVDKKHEGQFNKIAGNFESKTENAVKEITEKFENQNNEMMRFVGRQEDIVKGSDLGTIPQKIKSLREEMKSLDEKVESLISNAQTNVIKTISTIKLTPATSTDELPKKKDFRLPIIAIAIALILGIVGLNIRESVGVLFLFLSFFTGIVGTVTFINEVSKR